MNRLAFTMLELVFVIVIMGILGKFGVEFLARAYQSFIMTQINHRLQSNTATTVEFIASRLQHRVKDSIIARQDNGNFDALASVDTSIAKQYTVLEWIATDIEGFRGDTQPYWSGIADTQAGNNALIVSPNTNTTEIDSLIQILSDNKTTIDNAAIYFVGSNSDVTTDYGWSGNTAYMQAQNGSMHPITTVAGQLTQFTPLAGTLSDVYEYYKLSWTANALVLSADGSLTFHSDYQPWEGESYKDANKQNLLMQNVDTFQFMAIGSIVKIQICVTTDVREEYSLCKEKTIY